MSIPNTGRRIRRPTHPGAMLREEYLPDLGLTATSLARQIRVSRRIVSELINERRGLNADMALRLGRLFTQSPESWLGLQQDVDIWDARQVMKDDLARIKPLPLPPILTEEEFRRTYLSEGSKDAPGPKTGKRNAKVKSSSRRRSDAK